MCPRPYRGVAFSILDIPLPIPGTLAGAGILQELGHIGHQRGRWHEEAREEAEEAPSLGTVLPAGQDRAGSQAGQAQCSSHPSPLPHPQAPLTAGGVLSLAS